MTTIPIQSYKDLIVWQRSIELAEAMYQLTSKFPPEERFGLTSQMRRSTISIASNIAEGRHRGTKKDFAQFVHIAYGSGAELETQIFIAKKLRMAQEIDFKIVESLLNETMKMLNSMLRKLKARS